MATSSVPTAERISTTNTLMTTRTTTTFPAGTSGLATAYVDILADFNRRDGDAKAKDIAGGEEKD